MDLSFVLMLSVLVMLAVAGVIYSQTGWKQRRRRELERRHHANKRRSVS